MRPIKTRSGFTSFAKSTARLTGRPIAFVVAFLIIVIWASTGPIFNYSNTWQLVINTTTTAVTFLMVFLIQNSQNRDSEAIQIKLDELIRSMQGAHNALLDLEELEEDDLDRIRDGYEMLAKNARLELRNKRLNTGTPQLNLEKKPIRKAGKRKVNK